MPDLIQMLKSAIAQNDRDKHTFRTYAFWTRKFYGFIHKPGSEWSGPDVQKFMIYLYEQSYSASSRKQALNALAFIFRRVLKVDMGSLNLPPVPKQHKPLRTIPTRDEIGNIFVRLAGQTKLMAGLLYGSGLRVDECCKLRVQDIDFDAKTVRIHSGKGNKSRLTPLADVLAPALRRQIAWRYDLHQRDLANGWGLVELPGRLDRKYKNANRQFNWQFLFPSRLVRFGYRWHTTKEAIESQMRCACTQARIVKRVTPHTLRHAFATHALEVGNSIEWLRDRMGHEDLNTTAIYLHADRAGGHSPMDCQPQVVELLPSRISFDAYECTKESNNNTDQRARTSPLKESLIVNGPARQQCIADNC